MATFITVEEEFKISPDLRVTEASSVAYKALLYQHKGKLKATTTKIGNGGNVNVQLDAFFNLAKTSQADLVLTPEYCCPLTNLQKVLDNSGNWPEKRRLWVIGGESIALDELREFQGKYDAGPVKVHFDQAVFEGSNNFLCPLFYLFRENDCLHVIIQFKFMHCGVWSAAIIESENIILGQKIYVFGKPEGVRLFSLVCADATVFSALHKPEWMQWELAPYLILHPQLNPEPKHSLFIDFRKLVMKEDNKEIISLNWNAGSTVGQDNLIPAGHSRSGLFIKSDEMELVETANLAEDHRKGLTYFKFDAPNRHAFFCNSLVDAFLFKVHSVLIRNVPRQMARKNAPKVLASYVFSTNNELAPESDVVTAPFIQFLISNNCENVFLKDPAACVIEKERLVTLAAGEIRKVDPNWHELPKLFSIRLEEALEINNRLSLFEDGDRYGKPQRKKFIKAIKKLDGILRDNKKFPESMAALKDRKLSVGYSQEENEGKGSGYKFNLVDEDGKEVIATVCYLDDADMGEVKMTFDVLQGIVGKGGERGRVVVFFDNEGDIDSISDVDYGRITNSNDKIGGSITK